MSLATPVLSGPITATWEGGVGNWTDSNWSFDPATASPFPGNNGADQYNVLIDGGTTGTTSTVTLDTPTTIDSLHVDADDSLRVEGAALTIVRDSSRPASGSVTNSGSITVEAQGTGAAGLRLEGDVVFDGGGAVTLTGPAVQPTWFGDRQESLKSRTFIGSTGAVPTTLINQNHMIEGSGDIGFFAMGIENRAGGLIDANLADAALVLAGRDPDTGQQGLLNTGTLRASNGGILRLFAGTYDQRDGTDQGTIEALAGSRVQIEDSAVTIDGGALRTVDSGELLVQDANVTLNDVAFSNEGTTTINGAAFTANQGLIVNSGAIEILGVRALLDGTTVQNSGSILVEAQGTGAAGLWLDGDVVFDGGGAVTLTGPAIQPTWFGDRQESLKARIAVGPAGTDPATLINQNHTIAGSGDIGFFAMGIENRAGGLIDANIADAALVLAGRDPDTGQQGMLNTGTLRASNGGILRLFAGTYDQDDGTDQGTIEALAGSRIQIEDSAVTVDGGTLRTADSGNLLIQDASVTLDAVTFNNAGATTVDRAGFMVNEGAIENSGAMRFIGTTSPVLKGADVQNSGGITVEAQGTGAAGLRLEGDVLFDGGGVLTLTGPAIEPTWFGDRAESLKSRTFIGATGAMPTTLINQNHTIAGSGDIGLFGMGIENRAGGLIDANVTDAALVLAGRDPVTGQPGLLNTGTLRASNGGTLRLFAGTYDQLDGTGQGTIEALAGSRVHVEDSFVTIDGGALRTVDNGEFLVQDAAVVLNDLTFTNQGATAIDNASVTFNRTLVENSGVIAGRAGATIRLNDTGVRGGALNMSADGQLLSTGNSSLDGVSVNGDFENSGTLTIGRDGAALTGRYTQTTGGTVLDGGTLGASFLDIQGGSLSGNGTVDGPAEIAGLVDAGFSAGILNFLDDTTFSGTINLEIGGILVDTGIPSPDRINIGTDPAGTEYDQYNVFGTAMLDSALDFSLSLIDGFDPAVGDFFDVLTADLLLADLGALDFLFPTLQDRAFIASIVSFDGRDALRVSVVGTAAQVPEPGVLPLFGTGLLLLLVRHRRSRRHLAR